MSMLQIDITGIEPERIKKAIDVLTGNADVTDVSINAMAEAITHLTEEVAELRKQAYKPGDDDIGGKLHKDIVDSDDLDENYDHNLYLETVAMVDDLIKFAPQNKEIYVSEIRKMTGDVDVKPGKADHIYKQLQRWAQNAKAAMW